MRRTILLALLAACMPALAQVYMYRDVVWYEPHGTKINKVDGRLSIDREGGAVVFHKSDEVRRAIGLSTIHALRYYTQGDKMLVIRHETPNGGEADLVFRLKAGEKEREMVLMTIEASSRLPIERVDAQWR